jgi:hypothetical protein
MSEQRVNFFLVFRIIGMLHWFEKEIDPGGDEYQQNQKNEDYNRIAFAAGEGEIFFEPFKHSLKV